MCMCHLCDARVRTLLPHKCHTHTHPFRNPPLIEASQMTTKFLTIKFAKFPNFIVMEFPRKTSILDNFP